MAIREIKIIKIIQNLITALKQNNITISEAYLFGSHAENNYDEYSDIDLALVSADFSGILYHDIKKIGRIVRNIDYRIEVHTFSLQQKKNSLFLEEIRHKGSVRSKFLNNMKCRPGCGACCIAMITSSCLKTQ